MFSPRVRARISPVRPVSSFRLAAALSVAALAACTSPEEDGFEVPSGLAYDGTAHVAQAWGICKNASSYTAYWGLRHADGNGDTISTRWMGVNVNVDSSVTSGVFSISANTSAGEATAPAGKSAVWLNGVSSGSRTSTTARIRVSLFSGGDSARFIGTGIVLENGGLMSFNLTNATRCGV